MTSNLILKTNYSNLLNNNLLQKTTDPEKVNKYLKIIEGKESKLKISNDPDQKIGQLVAEILEPKIGRVLFKQLLKAESVTTVQQAESDFYDITQKVLGFSLNTRSFEVLLNEKGEKILVEVGRKHVLAHELIHVLHYEVEAYKQDPSKRRNRDDLIDDECDDFEEQRTILGIKTLKEQFNPEEIDPINENSFLAADQLGIRVNHRGLYIQHGEEPNYIDAIIIGASDTALSLMNNDPSALETPSLACQWLQKSDSFLNHKKLTPLEAAAYAGRRELLQALHSKGANPKIGGAFGSLLHAHVSGKRPNWDFFEFLMKTFALDINEKNEQGLTPLMCLLQRMGFIEQKQYKYLNTKQKEQLMLCIQKLVDLSDLSIKDPFENNILTKAIQAGAYDTALLIAQKHPELIDNKSSQGETAIEWAVRQMPADQLEKLLTIPNVKWENQNLDLLFSMAMQQEDGKALKILAKHLPIPEEKRMEVEMYLRFCN